MTNVIPFPQPPKVDDYFGGCPRCGKNDGWLNIFKTHWIRCDAHRTKWSPGTNIFSGWREENEEVWEHNFYRLESYRNVEPLPCSDPYQSGGIINDDPPF